MSRKGPYKVAFFSDILIRNADGAMRTIFQLLDRVDPSQIQFYYFSGQLNGLTGSHEVILSFPVPFNRKYKIAFPYFRIQAIYKLLDQWQPDAIHITSPSLLGYVALKYATKRNIPVLTIYHTHFPSYVNFYLAKVPVLINPVKAIVHWWLRSFYNTCNLVLVPAPTLVKELKSIGVFPDKLTVWARGIDTSVFDPEKRNHEFITSITKNTDPTIFFVCRLVWEKNLELLIKVINYSKNTHKNWNFIVAGDGPAADALKKQAPNAILTGALQHPLLAVYYASCDVFILPSPTETFGNVILEAMASGTPCIAARAGGPLSLISNGKNGLLCNPTDPEQWVEAIAFLLENNDVKQQMVAAALCDVKKYSWSSLVTQYEQIIENLASRK